MNPAFVQLLDGRLLDFKDGKDEAIRLETKALQDSLSSLDLARPTVLTVVPAHDALDTNEGSPLARVAHGLAALDPRYVPRVDALVRVRPVLRKALGGGRSIQANLESMAAYDHRGLRESTVVILDDTVTTGNSIAAARELLMRAGAYRVAAIALARTVKYFGALTAQGGRTSVP